MFGYRLSPPQPEKVQRLCSLLGMGMIVAVDDDAVTRELIRREILVDYRPGAGIRLSPHFYNAADEIDRVLEMVETAWHAPARAR